MLTRIRHTVPILLLLFILTGCGSAQPATATVAPTIITPEATATTPPANLTQVSGPYLGQPEPGSYSTRFAPAFVKGELHTSPVFMPDGSEVYWSSQESLIYTMRLENGYWTQPESIAFSDSMADYRDPFISPSGDKLFFLSKGRLPNSDLPEKENIWFVERVSDGWGEPQSLGEEVNALTLHWQVSVNNTGDIFFTRQLETPVSDIYVSKFVNGRYGKAEKLGDAINTDQLETTPYVAPDESYIIFARLKDQSSYPRLYISYADQNHNWGEPALIERVSYGLCPIVSPDGKYLFFLSSPQSVSWINASFIEEMKPQSDTESQDSIPISPDTVHQVELVGTLSGHTDKVLALAFSGNGVYMASDSLDRTIRLWDVRSGQSVHTFAKGENEMIITSSIAFSPDGTLLASAEATWDVEGGNIVRSLNRGQHAPVAFAPDGSSLAVALFNQPIKLWDINSGQVVFTLPGQTGIPEGPVLNIAFSPDGALLATSGHLNGLVQLWNMESGTLVHTLSHNTKSNIHALAFSPDGNYVATGGTDNTVILWDLAGGQKVHSFMHRDGLWSIAFSPDGTLLASAGCDGTVQIWDVESGKILRTLDHSDQVTSVIFSPDGTLLATGSYDNQIHIWAIPR